MSTSMLEYSKIILEKVSFDTHLFQKELKKAFGNLMPEEVKELQDWVQQKFIGKPIPLRIHKNL